MKMCSVEKQTSIKCSNIYFQTPPTVSGAVILYNSPHIFHTLSMFAYGAYLPGLLLVVEYVHSIILILLLKGIVQVFLNVS